MKLTPERIAEIKAAEAAATKGPWECKDDRMVHMEYAQIAECYIRDDAVFIAMARTAIPELLADREALTTEIERLKIQYEREAAQGDKFADIIERIASEGKKDRARAEAAESETAALTKKVDELEAHKIDYLGIRSLCGLEDDDSTVADFIDNLFGRAETAESDLAEARARIEYLEDAIYMAAVDTVVDNQGLFCRYCLAMLDEYSQGHKPECVYLSCKPKPGKAGDE